jgi:hydroxylamine reductase (hybrid-cluster protein)
MASVGKKPIKDFPMVACFPEANRTKAVTRAAWTVAMGIPTYFRPFLPVTGSPKTVEALGKFCEEIFSARLHVITQKMEYKEKVDLLVKSLKRA